MSLPDRIDPLPPKRIYRWDLDKTYLKTEFDTWRQMVRTALQKAHEKVAVPGAGALLRELCAQPDSRICIVSGSPRQMRQVLEEKLRLDGVRWDELVLKDSMRYLLRGRFRALFSQVGYKLPAHLESRAAAPVDATEICFGDDAEADAFIYSFYADLVSGRVGQTVLEQVLDQTRVYPDDAIRVLDAWKKIPRADPVRRIFIHLDRLSPPARFTAYGPRVVPVFNYFQVALVLMADGVLTAPQVMKVALELAQTAGHNFLTLAHSFQELLRRGMPLQQLAEPLLQTLEAGPQGLVAALRPMPDIVAAFTKRFTALGSSAPPPAPPLSIDYLALLEDARPGRKRRAP